MINADHFQRDYFALDHYQEDYFHYDQPIVVSPYRDMATGMTYEMFLELNKEEIQRRDAIAVILMATVH